MSDGFVDSGEKRLHQLGYKQELRRGLSFFTNFAFSFNVISLLTGITTTFSIGWNNGGPVALTYGWLLVGFMSTLVGITMAEVCSAFPTSGGLYFWAYKMSEPGGPKTAAFWSWVTGWFNALGQWAVTAAVDFSLALYIAMLLYVGTEGDYYPNKYVVIGIYAGVLFSHALVNSLDIRVVAIFENFSVFWHIVGTFVIIIALPVVAQKHQSASFVFTNFRENSAKFPDGAGITNNGYLFLVGLLFAQYSISGFDASAHMSEETKGADKTAPWGIIMSIISSTVIGWGYILALLFSIKDPENLVSVDNETGGYAAAQIFYDAFHDRYNSKTGALIFLCIPAIAIWLCGLSCVASNSRMVFAFSRDGAMPFSKFWRWVTPRSEVPVPAVFVSVFVSFVLGLPYLKSLVAFSAITSISTIGLYISYILPTVLRWVYSRKTFDHGPFYMGDFLSPIVSGMAILWVAFIVVLFVLPSTYPVERDTLNYAPIAVGFTLFMSVGSWLVSARHWFRGPVPNYDGDTFHGNSKPIVV